MKSLFESILIKRYGDPEIVTTSTYIEYWWNKQKERKSCVLFVDYDVNESLLLKNKRYQQLYGKFCGGFIFGDSLKIAHLSNKNIFGLYQIEDLQKQPEIKIILEQEPDITFFMDAANVWYYGFRDDKLFVYDAEMDEFDEIGNLESGIEIVIDEWENTKNGS